VCLHLTLTRAGEEEEAVAEDVDEDAMLEGPSFPLWLSTSSYSRRMVSPFANNDLRGV